MDGGGGDDGADEYILALLYTIIWIFLLAHFLQNIFVKNKMGNWYRFDLYFSYWIFVWWILYMTKTTTTAPKLAIYFALMENLLMLGILIFYKAPAKNIALFSLQLFVFKFFLLWSVWNVSIQWKSESFLLLFLLILYALWLWINKTNIYRIITNQIKELIKTEHISPEKAPFMALLDRLIVACGMK